MANSVAVIYINDELAEPKVLKAGHQLWSALPGIQIPADARVLCVKVNSDRGAPGSPSTFTDVYSGHDSYGLTFIPGMIGGGITAMQYDTEGGGTGKLAKAKTRSGSLDGEGDTGLGVVENSLIDLQMMNSDVVLLSYDVNATDFSSLLDEAFAFPIPPLP